MSLHDVAHGERGVQFDHVDDELHDGFDDVHDDRHVQDDESLDVRCGDQHDGPLDGLCYDVQQALESRDGVFDGGHGVQHVQDGVFLGAHCDVQHDGAQLCGQYCDELVQELQGGDQPHDEEAQECGEGHEPLEELQSHGDEWLVLE